MNPYPLAAELARPVARGHLTRTEADAALLAATLKAKRDGMTYDVRDVYRGLRHILSLHLEAEQRRRDLAAHRIRRRLKPLIAQRNPPNVLLAEAHDVNGAAGFPLAEDDVTQLTYTEMYWAMPEGRRHVR